MASFLRLTGAHFPQILTALVLLTARVAPAQTAALPATRAARIQAVENSLLPYVPVQGLPGWNLLDRMRHHRVPGLSIAVIHNYHIDWVKGYGLADTTARTPVTPQTLFSAGSISKLVAAGGALVQVQQGRLALDAPLNDYLKAWKLPENDFTRQRPPTLRLLLGHRGGTSQSSYWGFVPSKKPLPTVLDILNGRPNAETRPVVVNGAPGTEFRYSGGGYLAVQQAMTDVGGTDFVSLTRSLLFQPLRMKSATYEQPLPPALAARASWAYSANAWFKGVPYVYPQQAPAGLYATPTDIARFLIEVQDAYRGRGRVLTQASAQAMLTPQADISSGTYREQMGAGAFLLQRADRPATDDASRYFEHTGVNAGFLAYALASVTGGNGVVVMMNNDGGSAELGREVRRAVAQVYGWDAFLPPPVQPATVAPALLDAYAGRYQRGPEEVLTFKRVGNHLEETIDGTLSVGSPILCFPVGSADTIAFTDFVVRGVFQRNAAGQITGLQMPGGGAPLPRLAPDVLLPGELMRAGRLPEAIAGLRALHLNESQITYLAYELINRRPQRAPDLEAAEAVLKLAEEQHPQASMVFARWGDLHLRRADTAQAVSAFRKALTLDPTDTDSQEKLRTLAQ